MAITYNLTTDNVTSLNIGFRKDITIEENFLTLFLHEGENGNIRLKDIFINSDKNIIPKPLFDDISNRAKDALEGLIQDHLDDLNEQYSLYEFTYRDIETYLMQYVILNHQNVIKPLQDYVTEKVKEYILDKTVDYLNTQLPYVPKHISPSRIDKGSYRCSLNGYVCCDALNDDFFISAEKPVGKREKAGIYIVFDFDHPLFAISYYNNYQDKHN